MRVAILAAVLAAAGCYQPSVEACRYTCNNQQCPNGLACNAQGMCAESTTAMCNALPFDAPPDTAPAEVTVLVNGRDGRPEPGARVLFADAQGALVAETLTDANGIASADVGPGGSATVIRNVALGTQMHPWGTTYLDLPPGARVVCQQEATTGERNVLVRWTNPPLTQGQVAVHASCLQQPIVVPPGALEIAIPVPLRCPTFDVILVASDGNGNPLHAASIAAQTGQQVNVTNWLPVGPITTQLTKLPTNSASMAASASGWITDELPATGILLSSSLSADGSLAPAWRVPVNIGLTAQIVVNPTAPAFLIGQVYRERLPLAATTYARNFDGLLLPWLADASTSLADATLSWSITFPDGPTLATPDLVGVSVMHGDATSPNAGGPRWFIIAPASRLVTSGAKQSFALPDVPGTHKFEVTASSSIMSDSAVVFDVDDAAIDGLRGLLGSADHNPFDVPAVQHLTITVAN